MQHVTVRSPDRAEALNARAAKNIKDQMRQRGRMIEEDDELDIKLANTREYNAQIKTLAKGAGYKVFDSAALMAARARHGGDYAGIPLPSA